MSNRVSLTVPEVIMPPSHPATTQFGVTPDGEAVQRVTLRNAGGMQVDVITLGASLQGVQVPDREGRLGHVLLGHDTLEPYLRQPHFMGACVGRYANRRQRGPQRPARRRPGAGQAGLADRVR